MESLGILDFLSEQAYSDNSQIRILISILSEKIEEIYSFERNFGWLAYFNNICLEIPIMVSLLMIENSLSIILVIAHVRVGHSLKHKIKLLRVKENSDVV